MKKFGFWHRHCNARLRSYRNLETVEVKRLPVKLNNQMVEKYGLEREQVKGYSHKYNLRISLTLI